MLDIEYIRQNPELVKQNAKNKLVEVDIDKLLEVDRELKAIKQEADELREQRNGLASKNNGARPSEADIELGKELKAKLSDVESKYADIERIYVDILKQVPNMADESVPVGASEDDNVVTKTVGEVPKFNFEVKNHAQIAEAKGWLDKERAAKVAGSRFAYLKGDLVMLDWALKMYVLHELTNIDVIKKLIEDNSLNLVPTAFIPVDPPFLAKTEVYEATGRLNGKETTYKLEGDDLWLNASAEHTLAPMYLNEILAEKDLPIRYVGYTTAFRREAGTYGKDMEGFLRMHQFNKLEMETFSTSETAYEEHKLMVAIQEYIMTKLELPYRVLQKCTFEIGNINANGVDIEVWLPGQNKYRETHTADLIREHQARRMNTKVRRENGSLEFINTNDATALSQRPLIAILENYQTESGDVIIPKVLRPFMGNKEKI